LINYFLLYGWEHKKTTAEVAKVLNLPEDAVKGRIKISLPNIMLPPITVMPLQW
jgi:hypothetical protein